MSWVRCHINRLMSDGQTFTDCNYWKRFSYPTLPLDQAFITVLSDDGSVYSDIPEENTFPIAGTYILGSTYTTPNTINFLTLYGSPATFLQIGVTGATATVQLNGNSSCQFTIASGVTQVFNSGDLAITEIQMKGSGATAQVIAAVQSAINS